MLQLAELKHKLEPQVCRVFTVKNEGKILQRPVYALNQHATWVLFLPQPGFRGPGVGGVEVAPLIVTHSEPRATFLLPISTTLCSAGLEEEYVRNTGDSSGYLPLSITLAYDSSQWKSTTHSGRTANGLDPSGRKV